MLRDGVSVHRDVLPDRDRATRRLRQTADSRAVHGHAPRRQFQRVQPGHLRSFIGELRYLRRGAAVLPIVGKLPGNDISGSVITGNYQ